MAVRNVFMRNFPVVTCKAVEGTLTRYTNSVAPTGGINDGAAVYSVPIAKGDLVKIYAHTETEGDIIVQEATVADEGGEAGNFAHGIAVSDPAGIDNTTVSGQTPVKGLRRRVDVAFFGLGIIDLIASADAAVAPGDVVGLDENEQNEVKTKTSYASVDVNGNGAMVALTYAASGSYVAVLVGASIHHDAD